MNGGSVAQYARVKVRVKHSAHNVLVEWNSLEVLRPGETFESRVRCVVRAERREGGSHAHGKGACCVRRWWGPVAVDVMKPH